MTQNTDRVVEYSVTRKEIKLKEAGKAVEENLTACQQGISRDYQLLGLFTGKEAAHIFSEGLTQRLKAIEAKPEASNFTHITEAAEQSIDFDELIKLICGEFAQRDKGFVKDFCTKKKLSYQTIMMLLHTQQLSYHSALFVCQFLASLNNKVKMTYQFVSEVNDISNQSNSLAIIS